MGLGSLCRSLACAVSSVVCTSQGAPLTGADPVSVLGPLHGWRPHSPAPGIESCASPVMRQRCGRALSVDLAHGEAGAREAGDEPCHRHLTYSTPSTVDRYRPRTPLQQQHARICAPRRLSTTLRACGGAAARQAGSVATRNTHPLQDTTSIFHRPRALAINSDHPQTQQKYRAQVVRRIRSESGRSDTLIPLNHTKNTLA